jgi:hypothetical protein
LKTKALLVVLLALVIVESTVLAMPYASRLFQYRAAELKSHSQNVSFPFPVFNRPISNDTEHALNPAFTGSWEVDLQSSLTSLSRSSLREAEVAFAPEAASESVSIPTIILQERADGLLRIEYFSQNWPNTYGLLLYNSSTPGWTGEGNVVLLFRSFGSPSQVNPQLAPRPNGNLDVLVQGVTVVSDYPIAWANLSDLYLYGYSGSSFIGGSVDISISELSSS